MNSPSKRVTFSRLFKAATALGGLALGFLTLPHPASAQPASQAKPNIIMIISDDFGDRDAGVYGGGIPAAEWARRRERLLRSMRRHFPVCSPQQADERSLKCS